MAITSSDQAKSVKVYAHRGETGPQGPAGIQGVQGPEGPEGPAGPAGSRGLQGIQGIQGETGPAGPKGDTGSAGPQGPKGDKGDRGERGLTGATGPQGPEGPQGPQGFDGAPGPQGPRGLTGNTGAIGATGATGINWLGTWTDIRDYESNDAVFYGNSSWFASGNPPVGEIPSESSTYWFPLALQGATGATGAQGPQGETGATGPQGIQGIQGIQGEIGFAGFKYDSRRTLSNQYVAGEIIEYAGDYFICLANNDAIPPTGGALGVYWDPYSFVGPQGIQGETGATGPKGDKGDTGISAAITPLVLNPTTAELSLDQSGITVSESQVTGLVSDLAGKAASVHTHAPSDITGTAVITTDSRLSDARTPLAHTHAPADITGTAVITTDSRLSDARTPLAHTHVITDTTGLQTALDGKAATSHTHTKSQITDFAHTHNQSELTTTVSDKSANYTIVSGDANSLICSTAGAITITLANVLSVGQRIDFIQRGAGQITFAASGVTLNSADGLLKTAKQYAGATVQCVASGVYTLVGNLG